MSMRVRPPKPRFQALMWGQGLGIFIIVAGMIYHWLRVGGARVPKPVTVLVIATVVIVVFTIIVPLARNSRITETLIESSDPGLAAVEKGFADDPKRVQRHLWTIAYIDLLLVTLLVLVTGGITGSAYVGIFLMLPSIPLVLRIDSSDTQKLRWFTVLCAAGVLASFLMSHFEVDLFGFKSAQYPHSYDLALGTVTLSAVFIPLFQISVIRREESRRAHRTSGASA